MNIKLKYAEKNGVTYGITSDGYYAQLLVRPRVENLAGRFAHNGISVPSSGRWIVYPGGLITERDAKEIKRRKTVIPTLFLGTQGDHPIIQAR